MAINQEMFDEWINELESATRERIKKSIPSVFEYQLELLSKTQKKEDNKHIYIYIFEKPRFAVSKKDESIYQLKEYRNVDKKHKYGTLSTWREWDWSGYYPFERKLHVWEYQENKSKSEKCVKPKRKKKKKKPISVTSIQQRFPIPENSEGGSWPYTGGTS